jgi:hypothetical protein
VTLVRPALSSSGTRAVLIGTGAHAAGSGLPDVPAVGTTLVDLEQVLVSRCGMLGSTVRVLTDPHPPLEVGRVLAESARQAEDALLVCGGCLSVASAIGWALLSNR